MANHDQSILEGKLHLTIVYPDGTVYPGRRDLRRVVGDLGLDKIDLSGASVCDIATDEGFFAFWAESRGAERVLAIDVDDFALYDWGYKRDEEFIKRGNEHRANGGKRVFDAHHANLNSHVHYEPLSVYDLNPEKHGMFDVIFNFGLIYHLRHPLLSFDRARAVCKGVMIVETQINNKYAHNIPLLQFYRTTEHGGAAAWSGFSTACVTHMMKDAGFEHIFCTDLQYPEPYRQVFVGCVDETWASHFHGNELLRYCDADYWSECFDASNVWDGKRWTY